MKIFRFVNIVFFFFQGCLMLVKVVILFVSVFDLMEIVVVVGGNVLISQ